MLFGFSDVLVHYAVHSDFKELGLSRMFFLVVESVRVKKEHGHDPTVLGMLFPLRVVHVSYN